MRMAASPRRSPLDSSPRRSRRPGSSGSSSAAAPAGSTAGWGAAPERGGGSLRRRAALAAHLLAPLLDEVGGSHFELMVQLIGAQVDDDAGERRHRQVEHPSHP